MKGIWFVISTPIVWIGLFIFKCGLKILALIKAIDFERYYISGKQKITNKIEIGKRSSNNYVIQIVNNFQDGANTSKENIEKIAATTFTELKEQLYNIFDSGRDLSSSNLFFAFSNSKIAVK